MTDDIRSSINQWLNTRWDELVSCLQAIVREPSLAGNEAGAQQLIADKLRAFGLEPDVWEPSGEELLKHPCFYSPRSSFVGSPNVVAVRRGLGSGRSLILNGHIDVVPPGETAQWRADPFSGLIEEGRMYGRGVTDMKGGDVAMLYTLACISDLGIPLKGDLIFESVIEEESGGAGTLATILRGYRADAALIPEPSQLKIFPKQQGSMWFRVFVEGRAAHGGTRYEGVSAIEKTCAVIHRLGELESVRNDAVSDPLYQGVPIPFPINVGTIAGGNWPSSVPDRVEITGRIGVGPEEELGAARAALECAVADIDDEWLREHPPKVEWFGAQWWPGAVDPGHALMKSLGRSFQQITGSAPRVEASPWGTDGGLLARVGKTPAIVFGPGTTALAHYPNESIDLATLRQFTEILALTVIDWCGLE